MIKGSGNMKTETRTVEQFTRIETNLAVDLKIEVGKAQSISVTFDDNLIDFIRTESDGKTLTIDSDESFSSQNSLPITITVPKLDLLDFAGSGNVDIDNLNSTRFRLILSGSGEFVANGTVEQMEIEISGSGDVDASQVVAKEVTVTIDGSGSAEVNASEVLDAEINGSGDVIYDGKPPSVHSSVNGSGSIKKRR